MEGVGSMVRVELGCIADNSVIKNSSFDHFWSGMSSPAMLVLQAAEFFDIRRSLTSMYA